MTYRLGLDHHIDQIAILSVAEKVIVKKLPQCQTSTSGVCSHQAFFELTPRWIDHFIVLVIFVPWTGVGLWLVICQVVLGRFRARHSLIA
jgi:hypothetical protein